MSQIACRKLSIIDIFLHRLNLLISELQLNLLSTIRHENLVPLLGYCCENDQQILVYPFMSNGSLQDRLYGNLHVKSFSTTTISSFLYDIINNKTFNLPGELAKRKTLDWSTRLSIALGAARGKLNCISTWSFNF